MTEFKALVNIDSELQEMFKEIERYFDITLANELIDKIFSDAQTDQVTAKEYLIFEEKKKNFKDPMIIVGSIDEYEPETIWIQIKNIRKTDNRHFKEHWCINKRSK